jgi:hypothetical protein
VNSLPHNRRVFQQNRPTAVIGQCGNGQNVSAICRTRKLLPVLRLEEGEQVCVDLVLMRGRDAVRGAGIVDFLRAFDELG